MALRIGHSSGHTLGLRLVSASCVAGACRGQGEESCMNRTWGKETCTWQNVSGFPRIGKSLSQYLL